MKYALQILPLDFANGSMIDVMVKPPCKVLGACLIAKHAALVIAKTNGANQAVAQAALIVQVDPGSEEVVRRFVGLLPRIMIDPTLPPLCCEAIEHVATVFLPDGQPLAIYEAPVANAEIAKSIIEVIAS